MLSLPCATVFDCVSSGSCQERTVSQCLREDHSRTPAERDNQETSWVFLNLTRMEKHSNCPSFWKFECHQSSSVMLESSSTCCVDPRIRQRYFLSWILDWTCVNCAPLSRNRCSAPACLLVADTELIVTPMIQPFCSTSGLHE